MPACTVPCPDNTVTTITRRQSCSLRLLQLSGSDDEVILLLPRPRLGLGVCKDRLNLMQLLEALTLRSELQVVVVHLESPARQVCLEPSVLDDVFDCESVVRVGD